MQPTALFIDADNIQARYADAIVKIALAQGEVLYKAAYGVSIALRTWKAAIEAHHIREKEVRYGVKNAADEKIKNDVWFLFDQGLRSFCVATHDGGYSQCIHELCDLGCSIIGIGAYPCSTSLQLYHSCTDFIFV